MHDLTLLIQLFGRETLDRLSGAGFETTSAIARAGADRLAAEGGIDLPLARRIVSAALEALAAEELLGEGIADPLPTPPPRRVGRVERKVRPAHPERPPHRPLKPNAGSLASTPPAGIHSQADREELSGREAGRAGKEVAGPPTPAPGDPFIDEAGLVSWMGLSSRVGTGRALSFSVADAILDGGAPAVAQAKDEEAAQKTQGDRRTPAGAPRLIEGSFWSFGLKPDAAAAPASRPEGSAKEKRIGSRATDVVAGPSGWPGVPRRRRHDEQ